MTFLVVLFGPVFYYRNINHQEDLRSIFVRIYVAEEFSFISLFFYHVIKHTFVKRTIQVIIVLFLLFSIIDYIVSDKTKLGYRPHVAECLILLVYILYYFYEKIQTNTIIPVYQTNVFWIAVAFIIYCSGNFFLFLYSNQQNDEQFQIQYTLIYSTITILKNILLCIGVMVKQPKENHEYNDLITQQKFPDFLQKQEKDIS
ncbi:MAG: hypothetical protein JST86_03400 [Bacteroidetes bacterium]|nr:hypothetical protein [Bacteroidota bacterium]